MSIEETRHLDDKFDQVFKKLNTLQEEVYTIKRGVYGDMPNGVKGLIKTDIEQDERIKSLEVIKSKAMWTGSLIFVSFEVIWLIVKYKFQL